MKEPRLTIELVPKTAFYKNIRSKVFHCDWDKIRKFVYKRANYKCEICGGQGDKHPVECHEIWYYYDAGFGSKALQRLIKFIALCPKCHQVKHFGLSQIRGLEDEAEEHLKEIDGWDGEQAIEYIDDCFETWGERSQVEWKLDISYLDKFLKEIE